MFCSSPSASAKRQRLVARQELALRSRALSVVPAFVVGLLGVSCGVAVSQEAEEGSSRHRPRIAVGLGVAFFAPVQEDHSALVRLQPVLRLGARRAGWAPALGLDWFSTEVRAVVAGERTPLCTLRLRPIMAGVSYRVALGHASVTIRLMGGYAFNGGVLDDRATAAYRDRLGLSPVFLEVGNSLALSSGLSIWYGLTSRVGVMVATSYLVVRPEVAIVSSIARDATNHKADSWVLKAGVAFNIF